MNFAIHLLFVFAAADHCSIGGNPCKNGATCLNGEKAFECHCLPGFYGKDCGGTRFFFLSVLQKSVNYQWIYFHISKLLSFK